jgi:hypothetical protein
MVIDRASIFADRFKGNPQILQAAVLGQSPVPGLDPYTALRAMQLLKESQQMQMAQAAQQPTQSPSLVQAAMQMPQAPMGMPVAAPQGAPQAAPQQPPMMAASGGLASMPTPDEDYAEGGIVAFAGPTERNNYSLVQETPGGFPYSTTGFESLRRGMFEEDDESEGGIEDPVTQQMLAREAMRSLRAARKAERVAPMTPEQEMEYRNRIYKQMQTEAGASPLDAFLAKYNITPEKSAKMDDEDLGMALLEAAGEAVKPVGTTRGLAAAAAALGRSYGAAKKERRREEMATDRMRAELLDSQRKERMGMSREASAALERYRKDRQDATRAGAAANRLEAQTLAQLTTAFRPQRAAGEKEPKPELAGIDRIAKDLIKKGMDPDEAYARATLQYRSAGAGVAGTVRSMADARKDLSRVKLLDAEGWQKTVKERYAGDEQAASDDYIDKYIQGALPPFTPRSVSAPRAGAAPAAPAATAPRVTNW